MGLGKIGTAAIMAATILNPGMVVVAGATYLIGKWASSEYKDEVLRSVSLIQANSEGCNPPERTLAAATTTASMMETLVVPTCGLSALALHWEAKRMERLRREAEANPRTVPANRMRGIKKEIALGF